jgi:uncharacterized protein (DUF1778 family)
MTPLDQTPEARTRTPRDARLNLRTSTQQDALIRRAAEARGKTVSEFILDSATYAAEQVLADRRWFQLDDDAWRAFEALLDRPAVFKPRLSESLKREDPFVD